VSLAVGKKRGGRKRRMIMRTNIIAKEARILAAKQALLDAEVERKETRKIKNRKNKMKRRAKDKLRKA
jgi:hypothetical protein